MAPRTAADRARADAELAALVELSARRPRTVGFEGLGFVVGADGSATGASSADAVAAIAVVGRHAEPPAPAS